MKPPIKVVEEAIQEGSLSPCEKSKRGVVVFQGSEVLSRGHNAQPEPFHCNGSAECKSSCAKLCEHAEAMALRKLDSSVVEGDMLHVKVVDGRLAVSGGPSCWQCSRMVLADRRIRGFWLYHEDGWKRYSSEEFHRATLKECGLPVLEE